MNTTVIQTKKYVCDNCHYAFITSVEKGELPIECPFCNTAITCGTPDFSFED